MTDEIRLQLLKWRTFCDEWEAREIRESDAHGEDDLGGWSEDSLRHRPTNIF